MPGHGRGLIGLENGEAHFLVNSGNAESQASLPERRIPYESTAQSATDQAEPTSSDTHSKSRTGSLDT